MEVVVEKQTLGNNESDSNYEDLIDVQSETLRDPRAYRFFQYSLDIILINDVFFDGKNRYYKMYFRLAGDKRYFNDKKLIKDLYDEPYAISFDNYQTGDVQGNFKLKIENGKLLNLPIYNSETNSALADSDFIWKNANLFFRAGSEINSGYITDFHYVRIPAEYFEKMSTVELIWQGKGVNFTWSTLSKRPQLEYFSSVVKLRPKNLIQYEYDEDTKTQIITLNNYVYSFFNSRTIGFIKESYLKTRDLKNTQSSLWKKIFKIKNIDNKNKNVYDPNFEIKTEVVRNGKKDYVTGPEDERNWTDDVSGRLNDDETKLTLELVSNTQDLSKFFEKTKYEFDYSKMQNKVKFNINDRTYFDKKTKKVKLAKTGTKGIAENPYLKNDIVAQYNVKLQNIEFNFNMDWKASETYKNIINNNELNEGLFLYSDEYSWSLDELNYKEASKFTEEESNEFYEKHQKK